MVPDETDCAGVDVLLINTDTVAEGHSLRVLVDGLWATLGAAAWAARVEAAGPEPAAT